MNALLLLFDLVSRDFRSRYIGSYLGIALVFLQPLLFTLLLWQVLALGIRGTTSMQGIDTYAWIVAGYAPWLFFSTTSNECTGVFREYAFITRQQPEKTGWLPLVKAGSALAPHCFLLAVVLGINFFSQQHSGQFRPEALLWLPIAVPGLLLLTYSVGLLFAAFRMFAKDTSRIAQLLIQWGFFLTPIIWDYQRIPERFEWVLMINPMVSIIELYRHSLMGGSQLVMSAQILLANLAIVVALAMIARFVHYRVKAQYAELL